MKGLIAAMKHRYGEFNMSPKSLDLIFTHNSLQATYGYTITYKGNEYDQTAFDKYNTRLRPLLENVQIVLDFYKDGYTLSQQDENAGLIKKDFCMQVYTHYGFRNTYSAFGVIKSVQLASVNESVEYTPEEIIVTLDK